MRVLGDRYVSKEFRDHRSMRIAVCARFFSLTSHATLIEYRGGALLQLSQTFKTRRLRRSTDVVQIDGFRRARRPARKIIFYHSSPHDSGHAPLDSSSSAFSFRACARRDFGEGGLFFFG